MSLSPGTRLGQYEIGDAIGAGGMGEVYRATDTKLGRDVAIKTLPSALAEDTDRLARFEREAKLLAALNHPNIAVIYGLEEQDGTQCIAMELIEGETLEERLKDSALPVEDALRFALQIAQALEAAHEKGVIHRDLKPANVMVTGKGLVKVLDFGLAKAFSENTDQASLGQSPALSLAMTQQGLVLGTASYMSPEQASGQATDQRADVWAFGVVLFEMLSGLPLFTGESVPHILADVLKTEPDWNRLPKKLDRRIKRLLDRCLRKKLHSRYHSIADARIDVEDILSDPEGLQADSDAHEIPTERPVLPWVVASVIATAVIAGILAWNFRLPPEVGSPDQPLSPGTTQKILRLALDIGSVEPLGDTGLSAHLALSPDGSSLVYAAQRGGVSQLHLRSLDQLETRVIPGTEGAYHPFFSPDGEWIAYYADRETELRKVSVRGFQSQTLADAIFPGGGSWGADDQIFFTTGDAVTGRGLFSVPGGGGNSELLLASDESSGYLMSEVLPGGDAVLLGVRPGGGGSGSARDGHVAVLSLETGELRTLVGGAFRPRYSPTGHLVFVRADALWAVPFDLQELAITGSEVPVISGVQQDGAFGGAAYAFSDDGVLVYVPGADTGSAGLERSLVWVDRQGREEPVATRGAVHPRVSPDGEKLAVSVFEQNNWDVWIYDLVRGGSSRLTFDPALEDRPVWTPDGERVLFRSTRQSGGDLFWKAANGTGSATLMYATEGGDIANSFSPDGAQLVFASVGRDIGLHLLSVADEPTSQVLLETPFNEYSASISPDGRWLAYTSDETGIPEVFVRPFPNVEAGKWQVSVEGGQEPQWGPDSSELFYRGNPGFISVPVETDSEFSAGSPSVLFEDVYLDRANSPSYDVSPDGQRFLMLKALERDNQVSPETDLVVVYNWFDELNRLVPTE